MSRAHIVSPTELRLRQFLKTKPRVATPVIATLLRLDEWTRSIHAGEAESPLRRKLIARATAPDPIRQIAENLIEHASGIERDLLLKSVQEVLFYSLNFETGLNGAQIKTRLKQFLDHEKRSTFIRQFLSFYFFNYVWYYTGEAFRAWALTSQVFEKEMENVEKICEKIVASAFRSHEREEVVLDRNAAKGLIHNVEQRLRGLDDQEGRL
jgi:hypothetical protein